MVQCDTQDGSSKLESSSLTFGHHALSENIPSQGLNNIQKCLALEGVDTGIGCAINYTSIPKHMAFY